MKSIIVNTEAKKSDAVILGRLYILILGRLDALSNIVVIASETTSEASFEGVCICHKDADMIGNYGFWETENFSEFHGEIKLTQ